MAKAPIDDTFIEAFTGIYCRVIVTADDKETLQKAAEDATATPSVVIGRTEGGIERYLSAKETPDGREGAILQFWGEINAKKTFQESLEKFEKELSFRIRKTSWLNPSPQSLTPCLNLKANLT
jgi:formylmethanofuran--tetrahydromethanopterin N-formyltransferase